MTRIQISQVSEYGSVSETDTFNEAISVFSGTAVSGSVSANTTYQLVINLIHVDNTSMTILSLNGTGTMRIDITAPKGGVMLVNFNLLEVPVDSIVIFDISLQTENDLIPIFTPIVYILVALTGIAVLTERRRVLTLTVPGHYGNTLSANYMEIILPSLFAMVTFSFRVRIGDGEFVSMIIEEMQSGQLYTFLYWIFITLAGSSFLTRRLGEVRSLWTTFRGRERTLIYRILYAARSFVSIFSQTIGFYFLIFYVQVLNFRTSIWGLVQIAIFALVLSSNAVTHLSLFGILSMLLDNSTREVYVIGQILLEVVTSQLSTFTTYFQSTLRYISTYGLTSFFILISLVVPLLPLLLLYRFYIDAEVYS